MKNFKVGDTWQGDSYADMINKVLGTSYKGYMKATVPLSELGVVAWFVVMDGTEHGFGDNIFGDYLSEDGETIFEVFAGKDSKRGSETIIRNGVFPKRHCFQRDPDKTGNKYKCKYVGYFELDTSYNEFTTRILKKK